MGCMIDGEREGGRKQQKERAERRSMGSQGEKEGERLSKNGEEEEGGQNK